MTVMQNMPGSKYTAICKILDIVLIVLYVAFFLLSFFPYSDRVAGDVVDIDGYQYTMEEDDKFSIWGYIGFPSNHEWFEEHHLLGYNHDKKALADDESYHVTYKYKVVNINEVGPALCLNIFGLVFSVFLVIKNGNGRCFWGIIWGLCGIWSFMANNFLLTGNTWVRPVMLVIVIAGLAVNAADFGLKYSDGRRKTKYLRSISDVYK